MAKYIEFTLEEKERANRVDLVDFLLRRGEKLVRSGNEYRLIYHDGSGEHDSITVRGNEWYDHKNQTGGKPIDFLRHNMGLSFSEAVTDLLGNTGGREYNYKQYDKVVKHPPKTELVLPPANSNMHRVFAYLIKQRYIDAVIIAHFAHEHKIYENAEHHNVMFVGFDENGIARHAHKRGTFSFANNSYRGNVDGSDPQFSFNHIGLSEKLYVFEAPIDMLSFLTSHKKNWQQHSYVALCGVSEHAMLHMLEQNKNLSQILLCLDNDEGGIEADGRLRDILVEKGYHKVDLLCSKNKDWNEDLIEQNGGIPKSAVPHLKLQLYRETIVGLKHITCDNLKLSSSKIWTSYQDNNLLRLAEHSLSAAATQMRKLSLKILPQEALFSHLKTRLYGEYKPYTDKGKLSKKLEDVEQSVKTVMADLNSKPVKTETEINESIDNLYCLSDVAVRAYLQINFEPTMDQISVDDNQMEVTLL
jgi:hypothetical protein